MQKKWSKTLVSLCILFIAAMIVTTGCNGNTKKEESFVQQEEKQQDNQQKEQQKEDTIDKKEKKVDNVDSDKITTVLGEGDTIFSFTVVDKEEEETIFEIHTEKETVGEALLELELIDGDDSEYGLYVKTVNGITADYDKDGIYWAFYINDEYADTGVDSTKIIEGDQYSFRMQKG
mgnify:FL=1